MASYLIIESRDLTEYTSGRYIQRVALQLKEDGHEVILFLIENGVIAARKGCEVGKGLSNLAGRGAKVMAEEVSCRARGIDALSDGVTRESLDHLADLIVEGSDKVMWY